MKDISIGTLEDLAEIPNFNSFSEVFWGDTINDFFDISMNTKGSKTTNFKSVIDYLELKEIQIPDFNMKPIIQKRKSNDLLKIVWNIISNQTIDNTYFNGIRGKSGLLKWVNRFTDKSCLNFTESWGNGSTIYNIINHFYPKEFNISAVQQINCTYLISCLQKIGAPIYFDDDFFNFLDEKSIIIQYSSLFHYLSYPYKSNESINYFNANYLYSQIGEPYFNDGIIPEEDLLNFITENNQIIQNINNHFKVNMRSRYPKQISFIKEVNDELKVEYKNDVFEDVLKRAGSRPIIFISCLGRYQQGKTTINSGISGNLGYVVGNGNKETTKGVYIDGPYDINYLYQRFNISMRENIYFNGSELLTPLIYFFDIEGYDGIMHGDDLERNNKAFIEMCTPFLCLSSIFILLSESNANVQEINNFIDRVKVSKLTTYSNSDDSNGALKLNIIFNRYNSFCNSKNKNNITSLIPDFQDKMKKEWIGAKKLNDYGIKYEFYPILEGLQQFYDKGWFYEVFQYFVKDIVRSIENAAESKFVRSAEQSINLFNYIIQHFNDSSFEEKIKLLIKSEHERSFETFSIKSYNEILKKVCQMIDQEYEEHRINFNFGVNITEIKEKFIQIGDENIKRDLKVVQDHPKVMSYIELLRLTISHKIDEKHDDLIKYKKELIKKFNVKIEKKAYHLTSEILNQTIKKLENENNFNFDQTKIKKFINKQIKTFKNKLISFKNDQNMFLLPNQTIESITSEKNKFLNEAIEMHINNEKIMIEQLKEENNLKSQISQSYSNQIINEYMLIEEEVLKQLEENLTNKTFYLDNFKKITDVNVHCQNLISDYIQSIKSKIIDSICDDLTKENEINIEIIERLKQKNPYLINNFNSDRTIVSNKNDLHQKINQIFNNANDKLSSYSSETNAVRISFLERRIETRKIITLPDGSKKYGKWEQIRIERVSFFELIGAAVSIILRPFTIIF